MFLEFWIPALGLLVAVAVVLLRAFQVPPEDQDPSAADQRVYRDQLNEVDRDIAKGSVSPEEGERLRAEVARRLLETNRTQQVQPTQTSSSGPVPYVLTLALLAAGLGSYYFYLGAPGYPDLPLTERLARAADFYNTRPTQDQAEAAIGPQGTLPTDPAELALLTQLRTAVASRPSDLEGHQLLAKTEAGLGNLSGARAAYQQVVALLGDKATAEDHAQLAEVMIAAAGGQVTPQAEAELVATLNADPRNGVARYYSGLMLAQVGRPDKAFALWRPLLEESGPDAPWYTAIRDQIEDLAAAAGVNYTLPAAEGDGAKGPDAAAVQAAGEMTAQERQDMIKGMVGGLEQRLLADGGTPEDWAKLVTSLGVLGETDRAKTALEAGRKALAGDEAALAILNAAAGPAP